MINMEEIWKEITGFEGLYSVSNLGNIKSHSRKANISNGKFRIMKERILKPQITFNGYHAIVLNNGDKHKMFKIHTLVATHFIDNKFNLKEINHIDGNKLNNHINNIEWCSRSQNVKHSYDSGLRVFNQKMRNALLNANCRKVFCTKTRIIYDSVKDAAKTINVHPSTLSGKLNKKRRNNTTFKYL